MALSSCSVEAFIEGVAKDKRPDHDLPEREALDCERSSIRDAIIV